MLLGLVSQAAEGSSKQVASLLDASGSTVIDVTYHGAPQPEVGPVSGGAWNFASYQGGVAPPIAEHTCGGLVGTLHVARGTGHGARGTGHVIFGPGSDLERTYDLAFSALSMTAHFDVIYDFPPAGTSPAVHVVWQPDYHLAAGVTSPVITITGTQHQIAAG